MNIEFTVIRRAKVIGLWLALAVALMGRAALSAEPDPKKDSVEVSPDATFSTGLESPWTDGIQYSRHGSVARMVAFAAAATPTASSGRVIWSPHFADLSEAAIDEAHAFNIGVLPWTLNDPEEIVRAIMMGVDGLISDYPDRARSILARMGIELPAPLLRPAR